MRVFRKHRLYAILAIFLCLFATRSVAARHYSDTCKAVIFSDATKVKRLYGKRVHDRVIPASTTKVMTALVVMERLSLDSYVTVSHNATLPQPSKIYIKKGEQYKVRDLLYATIIASSNDASVALAEAIAGSHWKFVQMMNKKSKEIGAKNTHFANAHGLPSKEKQYTTAYDMYLIFRQALKYGFFRDTIKLKYKTIQARNGRQINVKSHNKILFYDWKKKVYGKTGYTRSAGACFVGTVQKGSSTMIIAVFKCQKRWEDIKNIVSTYGGIQL